MSDGSARDGTKTPVRRAHLTHQVTQPTHETRAASYDSECIEINTAWIIQIHAFRPAWGRAGQVRPFVAKCRRGTRASRRRSARAGAAPRGSSQLHREGALSCTAWEFGAAPPGTSELRREGARKSPARE